MQALGYLLIVAGFLGGSYYAVQQPEGVSLPPYLGTLAAGIAGVGLVRASTRRAARHEETLATNLSGLERSLSTAVDRVAALVRGKEEIDVYDLRHRIDEELAGLLSDFARDRNSITHSYGLQAFAEVMNPFAAGERYLNRVWSASTDGYIDEAHAYLDKAHEQFRLALQAFRAVSTREGGRTP